MTLNLCDKHDPIQDEETRQVFCKNCGYVFDEETAAFMREYSKNDEALLSATDHHIADGIFVTNKGTQNGYTSDGNTGIFNLGRKRKASQKVNVLKATSEEKEAMQADEEAMSELARPAELSEDEGPKRTSVIMDAYNTGRFMDGNGYFDESGKFVLDYRRDAWVRAISQYAFRQAVSRSGRHLNMVEMGKLGKEITRIYSRLILARDIIPQLVVEMAFQNCNLYPDDPYFNHIGSEKFNEAIENIKEALRTKCKKRSVRDFSAESKPECKPPTPMLNA